MALPEDPEMLVPAPILIPVAALRGPEASVQAVKTCDSVKCVLKLEKDVGKVASGWAMRRR